jgi:phage terminase large subunit
MVTFEEVQESVKWFAKHPHEFVTKIIKAEPTWQQKQVLDIIPEAIINRKPVAVKSGHGTGKTALQSWIIIWWMTCFPFSKIPCTAPTQRQLYTVLWSELAKWWKQSSVSELFEWQKTTFINKQYPAEWFSVALTSNKPDAMQGFHAKHLLFLLEEASGVPEDVMAVVKGTQTQQDALIMMFGNPTQISGFFHDAFNSKREFFYTFTFNSEESPIVDKSYCKGIEDESGRDSDLYRVRVLGEFPKAEPDTLIPLDRCEKASARDLEIPGRHAWEDVEIGVDVARYGDGETAIYSRIGNVIQEEAIFNKRDLMYVVGKIVDVYSNYKGKRVVINIDDSGMGGGVTDRLKELAEQHTINATVVGVNNGSKPKEERYLNKGCEMWFFMKEWLQEGKIPNDNKLIAQLTTRKYGINSSGKHVIETKEHMRDRGIKSPDRADGAVLTLHSIIYSSFENSSWAYAC